MVFFFILKSKLSESYPPPRTQVRVFAAENYLRQKLQRNLELFLCNKFQLGGLISAAADTGSSLRRGELLREKASEKSGAFFVYTILILFAGTDYKSALSLST
jgi:hypothetical protein